MPKSKTQAMKRAEKEERLREQEVKKQAEKEARDAALKQQYQHMSSEESQKPLSKKEARQLNKLKKKEPLKFESSSQTTMTVSRKAELLAAEKELFSAPLEDALEDFRLTEKKDENAPGRLVENHSTYCEGLRPVLVRLQKRLIGCTIIPGIISNTNAHCPEFELNFQRMDEERPNTYKFVARQGHTVQDVFVCVPNVNVFNQANIEKAIEQSKTQVSHEDFSDTKTLPEDNIALLNRASAYQQNNLWRDRHQQQHQEEKKREKEAKKEQKIKQQMKILATKNVPTEQLEHYATRDVKIIEGEKRGKHSMT